LAMSLLLAHPANREALRKIPQNQLFVPEWSNGQINSPGTDGYLLYQNDGTEPVHYVPGFHLKHKGSFFVSTRPLAWGSNPEPMPTLNPQPGDQWYDESKNPQPAPLVLDGWGNPIIFVPATGLRVRQLNGKNALDTNDASQDFIIVSPEGET